VNGGFNWLEYIVDQRLCLKCHMGLLKMNSIFYWCVEIITIYEEIFLKQIFVIGQLSENSKLFCVIKTWFNYQILLNLSIWLSRKEMHRYMFAIYVWFICLYLGGFVYTCNYVLLCFVNNESHLCTIYIWFLRKEVHRYMFTLYVWFICL